VIANNHDCGWNVTTIADKTHLPKNKNNCIEFSNYKVKKMETNETAQEI
jgi:hypothetical protein